MPALSPVPLVAASCTPLAAYLAWHMDFHSAPQDPQGQLENQQGAQ